MEERDKDRGQNTFGRFLGWVSAEYETDPEEEYEEESEEDHDDDHDDDHGIDDDEDEEEEIVPIADDLLLEDYEGDDEFDYPDEIVIRDNAQEEGDDEIDYADTAPAYQQTVHMTKKQKVRIRRFRVFYLALSAVVALNVIIVLLLTVNYLPPFGAEDNPAVNEVYARYVERGVEETGALNIVSAVLYAYRSFDTLGEAFVLFTAAIGVIILLRETKGEEAG
jgi:hypothetical protein